MTPVTADSLSVIFATADEANVKKYVALLNMSMEEFGIVTPERQAAFLAHVGWESNNLACVRENLDYAHADRIALVFRAHFDKDRDGDVSPTELAFATAFVHDPVALANFVYALRNGNGDQASGDGARYIGRGLLQVTGRSNYGAVSRVIFSDDEYLFNAPEALEEPQNAAASAAAFWEAHGCNELADDGDFRQITKVIAGGYTGYNGRLSLWNSAKSILL